MKRFFSLSILAALTITALAGIQAQAQTSYTYRDLGTLGGTSSRANGVNNFGQVVGWSILANGDRHSFYWSSATGMVDLGTFGGTTSGAWDINNVGDVVGQANNAANVSHAFAWNTSTYVLTDLNTLLSSLDAAKWTLTYAWKINDNRQVIEQGTVTIGGTSSTHGYLLDLPYTTITDLGAYYPDGINNLSPPQLSCWPSSAAGAIIYPSLVNLFPMIRAYGINNAASSMVVGGFSDPHQELQYPPCFSMGCSQWRDARLEQPGTKSWHEDPVGCDKCERYRLYRLPTRPDRN